MTRKCESPNHEGMPASRRARPLHNPLPPLPLPRLPCTSSNRDTRVQPEITPGWTQGGEAPSGAAPPPTTPNLPPQPEHTLLAGQSSRRSANGSGASLFQPRAVGSSTRSKVPLPIIQAESRIRHAIQYASLQWDQGSWGSWVKGGGSQEILS